MLDLVRLLTFPFVLWWSIAPYAHVFEFFSKMIPISHDRYIMWAAIMLTYFLSAVVAGLVIGALIAITYGRAYLPATIALATPTVIVLVYSGLDRLHNQAKYVLVAYQASSYAVLLVGSAYVTNRAIRNWKLRQEANVNSCSQMA